jgi:hypothetical protein
MMRPTATPSTLLVLDWELDELRRRHDLERKREEFGL